MGNTYTQINIHAIFVVKGRENIITSKFNEKLYQYIHGILKNQEIYPLAVNGYRDHIHIFFEMNPSLALSDILRTVKTNSSKWINEQKFVPGKFSWQEGYAAFSYSRSQRNNVIQYIINQKDHHSKKSFREEYLELLKKFDISFDDRYIFDFQD